MSKMTLHIAWTADDGPTNHTDAMLTVFKTTIPNKPIPVTWFIQWDNLKKRNSYGFYLNLQEDLGHEIAIHGVSTIVNHIHWFPSDKFKSYATIEEAVAAIKEFKNELSASGIHTKFVRAPTGLHSEITAYLRQLEGWACVPPEASPKHWGSPTPSISRP